MKKLMGTYGKTWRTWQVDHTDRLPLGIPQLMMGFTADGQANPQMIADRNKGYGISSAEKKRVRAEIAAPPIHPGVDAWQKGELIQLEPR